MSELAIKQAPAELLALADPKAGLPENVIADAFNTVYAGVGIGDIAKALVRCKSLGLNPLLNHIVMIPQREKRGGEWVVVSHSPFTTLAGRITIARQHDPKLRIAWDPPEIREGPVERPQQGKPDTEKRIYVTCHVWRSGQNDGPTVTKTGSAPLGKQYGEEIAASRAARNALKFAVPELLGGLDEDQDLLVDETTDGRVITEAIDVSAVEPDALDAAAEKVAAAKDAMADAVEAVQEAFPGSEIKDLPSRDELLAEIRELATKMFPDRAAWGSFMREEARKYKFHVKQWDTEAPIEVLQDIAAFLRKGSEAVEEEVPL